jgi:hypothetical protein
MNFFNFQKRTVIIAIVFIFFLAIHLFVYFAPGGLCSLTDTSFICSVLKAVNIPLEVLFYPVWILALLFISESFGAGTIALILLSVFGIAYSYFLACLLDLIIAIIRGE